MAQKYTDTPPLQIYLYIDYLNYTEVKGTKYELRFFKLSFLNLRSTTRLLWIEDARQMYNSVNASSYFHTVENGTKSVTSVLFLQ